jgi:23S rRNA (adenine2503-C2)-methyltransferase
VRSLYDVKQTELAELLSDEPRYRVDQVWHGLYQEQREPGDITTIPNGLRARLVEQLPTALREVTRSTADGGDTVKLLWELGDGSRIETVLMHYADRTTVCVSTQAGCAMACGFCATGQAGFERNLTTGEIVEQVIRAARESAPRRVSNVVFMGMGEPMANYDAVWAAVERLNHDLGIAARHLTISTVGIVPGILRLSRESLQVNLAVSLHGANDQLRNELVPIGRRYPLAELLAACRADVAARGRRLSFEWAMIDGVNDRGSDAEELAAIALDLGAHVNLIPLNPTPGWPTVGTSTMRVRAFAARLRELGANATVRDNRGTSIDAACGQLAAGQPISVALRTNAPSTVHGAPPAGPSPGPKGSR